MVAPVSEETPIGGESGIVVAKGAAEVNFAVRMLWKRD
ncbi:CU044_2847 family protein [Streptomyces bauhiniae]